MSAVKTIAARLKEIVPKKTVLPEKEWSQYAVDGKEPAVVVAPAKAKSVSDVLKFAHAEGLSVIPRGNGTKMALGHPPDRADIVLLTARLNRITSHEPADMVATAQAGATLADFQAALGKENQWVPLDPPHAEATIGGIIATRSSGPCRHLFGATKDLVLGLQVAMADGTLTKCGGRVVKNVTGYDLNKMYVGSLGSLAIILEATFRLRPVPLNEQCFVASFDSVPDAGRFAMSVLNSPLAPISVDAANANCIDRLKELAGRKTPPTAPAVMVGYDGVAKATARFRKDLKAMASDAGASGTTVLKETALQKWKLAIRDLPGAMTNSAHHMAVKVSVLPTELSPIVEACDSAGILCRAGQGVGHFYWEFADDSSEHISTLYGNLASRVESCGGHITVESLPTELKADIPLWGPNRGDHLLMRAIKDKLDPKRVLNPGRFVGGI